MAPKTPGPRPSKTSSSKKSFNKQPTPINQRTPINTVQNTASESIPAASVHRVIEEEIRHRAYELYEERGRQHGFEQEDWARAETEIRNKYKPGKSA